MTMIADYFKEETKLAASIRQEPFNNVLKEIKKVSQSRHTIFLMGNGTSGAMASHFANDLMKNAAGRITDKLGFGMKVISLSDNMPFFTAASNDISLDMAYTEYLRAYAVPDDLVIIFSSGIPHKNISEAAKFSYKRGLRVISLTGAISGELAEYSHELYEIGTNLPEHIEDVHSFLCHSWAALLRSELTQPVVFLDRDGVINEERSDYVKDWGEFRFLPGAAEAIRRLNDKGHVVVVVTNQSAVGRKIISKGRLEEIHFRMHDVLYSKGALISKTYYCPHAPYENCACRKPGTGLLEQAFKELPIDMEKGIMIGDSLSDIEAGQSLGITTVLLTHGRKDAGISQVTPDYSVHDLPSAVDLILSKQFKYKQGLKGEI